MLFPESWLFHLFLLFLSCLSAPGICRLTCKQLIFLITAVFLIVIIFSSNAYQDYPHYFGLYQSFFNDKPVLFDSEPGFIALNQAFASFTQIRSYRFFLCVQFIFGLSTLLVLAPRVFNKFNFFYSFAVLFFGCSAILIFVGSPRSGLSFCLALASLFCLLSNTCGSSLGANLILCLSFALLASLLHSQYSFQLLFVFFSYIVFYVAPGLRFSLRLSRVGLSSLLFSSFILVLLLFVWRSFSFNFYDWFLAKTAGGDLNRLISGDSEATRLTAVFSLVYPAFFLVEPLWKRLGVIVQPVFPDRLRIVMGSLALSGALLNIVFYSSPHFAGRLSRLSEFAFFPLIPIFAASLIPAKWRSLCVFASTIFLLLLYPVFYGTNFR